MTTLYEGLPSDLMSSENEGTRRLRTEAGNAAFNEGREYRLSYKFSIASGSSQTLKFEVTQDLIVTRLVTVVDTDGVEGLIRGGATETSTFSDTSPVVNATNLMSIAPTVASGTTVTTGGSIDNTTGSDLGTIRVRSAGATAQRASVAAPEEDRQGVGPGSLYLELSSLGAGTATGVVSIKWEELP